MTEKPFDESDLVPHSPGEDPEARTWLYVLTTAVTIHRDQILVLETEGGPQLPAFLAKESAAGFRERLGSPMSDDYAVQAMHLVDVRGLAAELGATPLVFDAQGRIIGTISGAASPPPSAPAAPGGQGAS
jgi:hypothetical protein